MPRKPLFNGEKLERVTAYLPHSLREWVEEDAAKRGTTLSGYTREVFQAHRNRESEAKAA